MDINVNYISKRKVNALAKKEHLSAEAVVDEINKSNDMLIRALNFANKVKGTTSRASKNKLEEEISALEHSYAFEWIAGFEEFNKPYTEVRKILKSIKVPPLRTVGGYREMSSVTIVMGHGHRMIDY